MNITVIQAIQTFSVLEMEKSRKVHVESIAEGSSISDLLKQLFPGFVEFQKPTVALLNGEAKMRETWAKDPLKDGDSLLLLEMPQGQLVPYIYLILVAASIAIAFLIRPSGMSTLPEADSVYNLKGGKKNQIKLGSPIEVPYGRCRLYPSYASAPYNEYQNNEQYLFALFCLGQGEYEIERHLIDDTDINEFADVSYQVYLPGEPVELVHDNVITSIEVNNIELLAPDAENYEEAGPFVVNEAGTTITQIAVDITLPGGLYSTNKKGKMKPASIAVTFSYQQIDNDGNVIGGWVSLVSFARTMTTNTAQRFTISTSVSSGRYQVKGHRVTLKDPDNKITNTTRWEALRGYKAEVRTYPGVTTVALKMKASYQLNDTTATTYNVWATRKLPIYDADRKTWSTLTATRSPIWAMCDVFRSKFGGQLDASRLDLDLCASLATKWENNSRYFDYVFDQRSSVWEAAKTILSSVRAVPIPLVSVISIVEDTPHTLPTAIFGPHNMVAGSFKWKIAMPKAGDFTGVRVTYINPDDFLEDTIDCLDGDDTDDNLEEITLLGQTDKIWAYRDGLYLRRQKKYIRETFSFTVGLEGHLPLYGAMIGISHDIPNWSQFGLLLGKSGSVLELSEPVSFESGSSYVIGFRQRDGTVSGPYAVHEGEDDTHIVVDTDFGEGILVIGSDEEPPLYLFGTTTSWAKKCIVSNIEPNDDDTVTIEAYGYVNVFQGDTEVPEEESGSGSSEPTTNIPDIPVLNCSSVYWAWSPGSTSEIYVTWSPTLGAWSYDVEYKTGVGSDWTSLPRTTESYIQIPVENETELSIRVHPIGKGVGEWCTHEEGVISSPYTSDDSTTPGTYDDLNGGTGGGAPLGSIAVQARGGSWSLVGFSAWDGTEPSKRWLVKTASGTAIWQHPGLCITYRIASGSAVYDPTTGLCTSTIQVLDTPAGTAGGCWSSDGLPDAKECGYTPYLWHGSYDDVEQTATMRRVYGIVPGGGTVCTGENRATLSNEDTADGAVARLIATSPEWGAATTAIRTIPMTGITGVYREARYRTEHTETVGQQIWIEGQWVDGVWIAGHYKTAQAKATYATLVGLSPWQRYRVTVALESRPVDSAGVPTGSGEWSAAGTRQHYILANIDGEGGIDWQVVEPTAGYETRIASTLVEVA